ncbi:MAG: CRISPR-associated endonuclease Cas2 [Candidatus Magnetominusculus sp. LBB02]|nr:CRISPR-associated endonuclease Cas2 [Candidatus Magnetominusculus sp. LBB02]
MCELNKYKIMWLIVLFDLPTDTSKARKAYTKFRNFLLDDGFNMMQYSVYYRHCASRENAEAHTRRIKAALPEKGSVNIISITDKQFGDIQSFVGRKEKSVPNAPHQLELF